MLPDTTFTFTHFTLPNLLKTKLQALQLRLEYKKFKPAYPQPVETACKPKDQVPLHCK